MPAQPSLHTIPRNPHAWAWITLALHLAVALAWWQLGWRWGLPLLLVLHLAFVWGTLRPGSRLFGPVRCRVPTAARGHGIGNHSYTHPQARFWALGPRAMRREILDCQRALTGITGVEPRWFRAVVGHANPFVHAPLRDAGLARLAWSARGYDAVEPDASRVSARIARDLAPGAIVLLHEGAPHGRSVEAIAAVLGELERLGYRAVVPRG